MTKKTKTYITTYILLLFIVIFLFSQKVHAFEYENLENQNLTNELKNNVSLVLNIKTVGKKIYFDDIYIGTVLNEEDGDKGIKLFLDKYNKAVYPNQNPSSRILNKIKYKETLENYNSILSPTMLSNKIYEKYSSIRILDFMKIQIQTKILETQINSIPFQTIYLDDENIEVGTNVEFSKGIDGKCMIEKNLTYLNGRKLSESILNEKILNAPISNIIHIGKKSNEMLCPANGFLSSTFGIRCGKMHKGIDIGGEKNSPILSVLSGKVVLSGWENSYGNYVIIEHNENFKTLYAHLNQYIVNEGDIVKMGDTIGYMGSTGDSSGNHLHFEILKNEENIDPLTMIKIES